jgi:ParB-like nuclease domain
MNAQDPLTVHPAAEAYRTMNGDELASLAADIGEHGQHDPIILGRVAGSKEQHRIVDGRNRARACGIAKAVPKFETREFENEEAIRAFVKSRSERRDITKGQRAMGHALLYPDPERGGRGKKGKVTETVGFSSQRLSYARTVLAYSRDLALAVRDGTESLDAAYATVTAERQKLDTKESKLARLQKTAPDLAELVTEERMGFDDAIAAINERERKTREIILAGERAADGGMTDYLANIASIAAAVQLGRRDLLSPERLDAIIKATESLWGLFQGGSHG